MSKDRSRKAQGTNSDPIWLDRVYCGVGGAWEVKVS